MFTYSDFIRVVGHVEIDLWLLRGRLLRSEVDPFALFDGFVPSFSYEYLSTGIQLRCEGPRTLSAVITSSIRRFLPWTLPVESAIHVTASPSRIPVVNGASWSPTLEIETFCPSKVVAETNLHYF